MYSNCLQHMRKLKRDMVLLLMHAARPGEQLHHGGVLSCLVYLGWGTDQVFFYLGGCQPAEIRLIIIKVCFKLFITIAMPLDLVNGSTWWCSVLHSLLRLRDRPSLFFGFGGVSFCRDKTDKSKSWLRFGFWQKKLQPDKLPPQKRPKRPFEINHFFAHTADINIDCHIA